MSFLDSCLAYRIDARVIGKASDYKYKVDKDQYVVSKEASCPIRVVPTPNLEMEYNFQQLKQEAELYYRALWTL